MSRQYIVAAKCINSVHKGVTFKAYCSSIKIGKTDYALAIETLKYEQIIQQLLVECGIELGSIDADPGMFLVMVYELLLGPKRKIQGGGAVKRLVLGFHPQLERALRQLVSGSDATELSDLLPKHIKDLSLVNKYARVNELKVSAEEGYIELHSIYGDARIDGDIPGLIVLPPCTKALGELDLVKLGFFILQDKASCFPSQICMDVWKTGDIVDACAAPGNKTSHLASQMFRACSDATENASASSMGRIFAFEKDSQRFQLLSRRMEQAGASDIVCASNQDFLDVDWSAFPRVSCVLLDPSCSGSGIAKSINRTHSDGDSRDSRLGNLRRFQVKALLHALTCPSASVVVYSTCSVNVEENESVVAEALATHRALGWSLSPPARFASWPRRGLPHECISMEESGCLLRCLPEDGMNGFFVALFVRGAVEAKTETEYYTRPQRRVISRKFWRPL